MESRERDNDSVLMNFLIRIVKRSKTVKVPVIFTSLSIVITKLIPKSDMEIHFIRAIKGL